MSSWSDTEKDPTKPGLWFVVMAFSLAIPPLLLIGLVYGLNVEKATLAPYGFCSILIAPLAATLGLSTGKRIYAAASVCFGASVLVCGLGIFVNWMQ